MIRWLHKYIFRGLGIVIVIGMITSLLIAVVGQMRHVRKAASVAAHHSSAALTQSGR